jgi:hypothetical protein
MSRKISAAVVLIILGILDYLLVYIKFKNNLIFRVSGCQIKKAWQILSGYARPGKEDLFNSVP